MAGERAAKSVTVSLREATRADIPALVELNRATYPTLAEDNVVWRPEHLANHQRVFPQGQLVAEVGGKILGACSSLIVDLGPDPLRNHTWAGITDSGYFNNHNPRADTLYGADVYVHPDARGKGVGRALYEGRRRLCKRLNLRRILAGGRLWNYEEQAPELSAEEYASRVAAGEFRDLVLSFQLSQGFVLRGVMPNYLRDPLSKNYASLIEWINPEYKPPDHGSTQGARGLRAIPDAQGEVVRPVCQAGELLHRRGGRLRGAIRAAARAVHRATSVAARRALAAGRHAQALALYVAAEETAHRVGGEVWIGHHRRQPSGVEGRAAVQRLPHLPARSDRSSSSPSCTSRPTSGGGGASAAASTWRSSTRRTPESPC